MGNIRKIKLAFVGFMVSTVMSTFGVIAMERVAPLAGIATAYAAGPNNGANNPAKCKSATNPKCTPASPSM